MWEATSVLKANVLLFIKDLSHREQEEEEKGMR